MMAHPPGGDRRAPVGDPGPGKPTTREICAVVFVDVVESVRLIELDETRAVASWWRIEDYANRELLPRSGGRAVKRLGDGLMLEFRTVRDAIGVAFGLQAFANAAPQAEEDEPLSLKLRVAVDFGEVLRDAGDIFGHHVNVAARLLSIAGAGEIVASADAVDQLTPSLDADVEDLGPCYLKNLTDPVRAFRLRPPGASRPVRAAKRGVDIRPVVAIIPFTNKSPTPDEQPLGDFLADDLIHSLSRTPELAIVSRLSTAAFRGGGFSLSDIRRHLRADYVVSGAFRSDGRKIALDVEVVESASGEMLLAKRLSGAVVGLFSREQPLVSRLIAEIGVVILSRELSKARSEPLPNLPTYTLLLGAVALMHRMGPTDFMEARTMLEAAIDRASHQPIAQAWLAKWHVLRVQQRWSEDPLQDARDALELTRRALNSDPDSSLALAVDGLVHTNLLKNFDVARERYESALRCNPNDNFALLLRGMLNAFCDRGAEAVRDTAQALALSPLDPHRYYYDSLAASAHLTHRRYKRAVELALRSLRANRLHTSTWRVLTVAQWQLGQVEQARASAQQLLKLEPDLTIEGYRKWAPSAGYAICEVITSSLSEAGVPLR